MGHVKAVQDSLNNGNKALSVILHGDAAVAGQNIVYECLQMDYLPHYGGHGTIHVI
jgi:2-oxoglutarate dehydrogenase E1 component